MAFKYTAVDEQGKKVTGIIRDKSKKDALKELSLKKLTVMSLEKTADSEGGKRPFFRFPFRSKISTEEKIILNLQFANLLSANLSIIETLEIIQDQTRNAVLKNGLKSIKKDIEKGIPIYEAFGKSGLFDELTVNMLKAGEESSKLDVIFSRLSTFSERQFYLMQNIKSVLAYPVILLVMGGFLTVITMTFVFPKFIDIFESQGDISLPLITRIVAQISYTLTRFWYAFLLLAAGIIFFLQRYFKSRKGKLFLSRSALKIPLIKNIVSKVEFSRFFYSMQLLLTSGVDIIDSIEYAKGTLSNLIYRDYIESIKIDVQKGKSLSELLQKSPYIPEMAVRMVSMGEKTGELEPFLERAASYMEVMFNYQMKRLIIFIEPAILIVMGIFIGILMASFILPLFQIVRIRR